MFTKDLRVTYGVYANARGITDYQNKIDEYHGALAALATLYCVQLVHIIYNGFAWEKLGLSLHGGLTIVF